MAFSSSGHSKMHLMSGARTSAPPYSDASKLYSGTANVSYMAFTIAAVVLSCVRAFTSHLSTHKVLISLLTHALFPRMLWLLCLTAFCVPLRYAISPPIMPDREELLEHDPKTGIAHPKPY